METHPPVMKQINSVFKLNSAISIMQENQAEFSVVHESKYLAGNAISGNGLAKVLTGEVMQLITLSITPPDNVLTASGYAKGEAWS